MADFIGGMRNGVGIEQKKGSSSFASILSALLPTWALGMLFLALFVMIRHRYPHIYSPRTYMGTIPERHRTPSQRSKSYFDWLHTLRVVPDKFVLYHSSIDGYLYLRFLRTIILICIAGCIITWPILMPVNATGGGQSTQLDRIGIGNVAKPERLYAHAAVAWVFFGFIMFLIARERLWLIGLRQAWSLSTPNTRRLSSRTVLFLAAPRDCLKKENFHRYFGSRASRLWPATKAEILEELVKERNSKAEELEKAEVALIKNANKKAQRLQSHARSGNGHGTSYESLPYNVKKSARPSHRPSVTSFNYKVDSIEWLREQIKEKDADIRAVRDSHELPESHGAAAVFVEFETQTAAQRAYQQLASTGILSLTPRFIGVTPDDVVWDNLTTVPASRISKEYLGHALVAAAILWWSIPIAFVGAISNIEYLAENVKWLQFLRNIPQPYLGLLTGLVPPALISALTSFVPNIFRFIATSFGEPTNTSAEVKVLKWYYIFQVVQVFLVTTLSSGAAAVASQIAQNPSSIPDLLAERLPRASNFYLTYFIIQGTTTAADNFLNYSDLLSYMFFNYFFDKTPRQKFNRYARLKDIQWGKYYPKYTTFAIIAIAYSCIAPLVLGFAAIALSLLYHSYRYNLLFVMQPKVDTKGHSYTLALQQLLTGVYIAELALIGFFGLYRATGPTIMIIMLFIVTMIYNFMMNKYFGPYEQYLPADLTRQVETGDEETPLLASAEEGTASSHDLNTAAASGLPSSFINRLARFFEPQISTSYRAMKAWLEGPEWDEDDVPEYSEEELTKAYMHPAFTSSTPLIWLPRDGLGVSKNEVKENEEEELNASDKGAWIDEKGRIHFDQRDFTQIPIEVNGVKTRY